MNLTSIWPSLAVFARRSNPQLMLPRLPLLLPLRQFPLLLRSGLLLLPGLQFQALLLLQHLLQFQLVESWLQVHPNLSLLPLLQLRQQVLHPHPFPSPSPQKSAAVPQLDRGRTPDWRSRRARSLAFGR